MKIFIFIIGIILSIVCSNYLDLRTQFKSLSSFNDKLMKDYKDLEEKYHRLEMMTKWFSFLTMKILAVFM